jgi:hypothetical protein
MYDISELKVGDIMVCGREPTRQLFYIHNINITQDRITTSGVNENSRFSCFEKSTIWSFDRKATEEEGRMFYELIERNGFEFNLNIGVKDVN